MDGSPPGSSIHGVFQAAILAWVATSFSRGSSPALAGTILYCWAPWEAHSFRYTLAVFFAVLKGGCLYNSFENAFHPPFVNLSLSSWHRFFSPKVYFYQTCVIFNACILNPSQYLVATAARSHWNKWNMVLFSWRDCIQCPYSSINGLSESNRERATYSPGLGLYREEHI